MKSMKALFAEAEREYAKRTAMAAGTGTAGSGAPARPQPTPVTKAAPGPLSQAVGEAQRQMDKQREVSDLQAEVRQARGGRAVDPREDGRRAYESASAKLSHLMDRREGARTDLATAGGTWDVAPAANQELMRLAQERVEMLKKQIGTVLPQRDKAKEQMEGRTRADKERARDAARTAYRQAEETLAAAREEAGRRTGNYDMVDADPAVEAARVAYEKARAGLAQAEDDLNDFGNRVGRGAQGVITGAVGSVPMLADSLGQYFANSEATDRDPAYRAQAEKVEEARIALNAAYTDAARRAGYGARLTPAQREALRGDPAVAAALAAYEAERAKLQKARVSDPVAADKFSMQMMGLSKKSIGKALEDVEGPDRFLGETALSIGQNALYLPLAAINPALPLLGMGANAAGSRTYELLQQGVDPGEAFVRGLASGGIEALTEKIPLDNLLDIFQHGGKGAVRNLLKQAGVEATEEGISYVMNYAADKAAKDPNASFSLNEMLEQAAAGGLSGLFFGGMGTALHGVGQRQAGSGDTPTAPVTQGPAAPSDPVMELAMETAAQEMREEGVPVPSQETGEGQAQVAAYARTLGRVGGSVFSEMYDPAQPAETYLSAMTDYYNAGRAGADMAQVRPAAESGIDQDQAEAAYIAGKVDGKEEAAVDTGVGNGYNGITVQNQTEEGQDHGGEGEVYLRRGGQRVDGAHPGGQVRGVEGGAGQGQGGDLQSRPRDAGAAALSYGEAVTTGSLGIGGGSNSDGIRLVTGGDTEATGKAREIARENGLRLVLFGGGNLSIQKGKRLASVRGYVSGDRVFVRVDHPEFTAEQIMRHEAGHVMIRQGKIDTNQVRKTVAKKLGRENLAQAAARYEEAYRATGLTADRVWEEVICDSLGDMNLFAELKSGPQAAQLLEATKQAAQGELEANKTRGPPTQSAAVEGDEGKMSQETGGPRLSRQEWRQVQSAQVKKYAGMAESEIPQMGTVFAHDMFYVLRNYGLGEFEVTVRLDPEKQQSYIDDILGGHDDETIQKFSAFNWANPSQRTGNTRGRHSRGPAAGDRGERPGFLPMVQKPDAGPDAVGLSGEGTGNQGNPAEGDGGVAPRFSQELSLDSEGRELSQEQAEFFKDSKARDEGGKLLVLYHGTDADFTVFDQTKSRAKMDIQGSFFSPWEIDAADYGGKVGAYYLNLTNPADERTAYRALKRFQGQNNPGAKARDFLISQGYDGVSNSGEEYIAFYPEQIKRTTNLTPTSDPDIRFSQELEDISALREENRRLRAELKAKKAQYEHWKGQTKVTTEETRAAREGDVKRLARSLIRDWSGTLKAGDLARELQTLGDAAVKGAGEDQLRSDALAIAERLVESAVEQDDFSKSYQELRDYLHKTKMAISPEDSHDIPDFGSFRKRNMGRFTLSRDGVPVDTVYQELQARWPEFFSEEKESAPADQLLHIAEVLDTVAPKYENPHSLDMDMAVEYAANDILERLMGGEVRENPPTFADRQAQKVSQAKERGKKALARERENRRAGELRRKIVNHSKVLSQKLFSNTDKKHIPDDLRKPVAALLEAINQESAYTVDPETGKRTKNGTGDPAKRTEAFRALKEQYAKIKGEGLDMVIDPDLLGDAAEGFTGLFDQVVAMKDTRLADMTTTQLSTVWKVVRAVEQSVRTAGKVLSKAKFRQTVQWANALAQDTQDRRGRKTLTKSGLLIDMETPYTFFSHFGESGKAVYRMLRDAQDRQQVMVGQAEEAVDKILDTKTAAELRREAHTFTTAGGDHLTLTTDHIMDLYNLWQRQQARDHLLVGGIVQPEVNAGKTKVRRGKDSIMLTAADVADILSTLTADQVKIAQEHQKLCTGPVAQFGNEASMAAYGYKKFTEPDYWPIHSAREGVRTSVEKGGGQPRSIRNVGMAKATVPHANNPLDLMGLQETFAAHVGDMSDYGAFLCAMEDAERLFNFRFKDGSGNWTGKTVKGLLDTYGGPGAQQYWRNLMEDIQNGIKSGNDSSLGSVAGKITGNVKGAAVGANLRVVIQQPTAWIRAALVLDPRDMAHGLAGGATKGSGWKKALQYSPIAMRKAMGGFDISTPAKMSETLYDTRSGLRKFNDAMGAGAGAADALTWGRIWNACEWAVAREEKGLTKGSKEFYEAVNRRFTDAVDQTQVVDGVLQRSQVMRSGNALVQQASSFMGEPIMSLNMVARAYDNLRYQQDPAKRGRAIKLLGRATTVFVVNAAVNALAQALIDGLREDDKDKKYWERVLSAFTGLEGDEDTLAEIAASVLLKGNVANNLNPAGAVPFVSDILSLMQGYSAERLDMSAISDVISAGQALIKSMDGKGAKTTAYALKQLGTAAGKVVGISAPNIIRDVWGIGRSVAIETDNYRAMYQMEKAIYALSSANGSRFYDILYKAKADGDQEVYDYIYADMLENGFSAEKLDSAMRDRAKEEKGYLSGVESVYKDVADTLDGYSTLDRATREKALEKAHELAKAMALEESSGGEYTVDTKWMQWAIGGEDAGVDEAEAILFKLAYDMAQSETDPNTGKTISVSKKENTLEAAEEMMPWLTEEELRYLRSNYWKE